MSRPVVGSCLNRNVPVSELSNVVWRIAVPSGTTLVSHSIAGWSNVGPATPTAMASLMATIRSGKRRASSHTVSGFRSVTVRPGTL